MSDKPAANLHPAMFSHRVHEIQAIARAAGYAIAIHGSMQRDLDVIAIPWTKQAIGPNKLIRRLCEQMGLTVGSGPDERPHGRLSWALLIGTSAGFVDISVMPRKVI